MDNLASSDLDSPSKTPLFIAVAAVIVAIAGLVLGYLGFSRAAELEAQLSEVSSVADAIAGLESSANDQGQRVDAVVENVGSLSRDVKRVLGEVEEDISKIKRDLRSVAIEAGSAKRMVEELEKSGVKVAAAPAPAPASTTSSGGGAETKSSGSSEGGIYTIKSGDTLGKIAAAYNITLSELQAANPGVDPRRLRIGQQIVIPAGK